MDRPMEAPAQRAVRGPGPWALLLGMMTAYVAFSVWLSILRWQEFATSNWDLGIFQQSLWATTHGHPFYEAGDWESFGSLSLLQVHPSFVLYLLVPIYALAPQASTLFVVQSVAAAAAAVPLYLIGLRVIGRAGPALALAGLYLASAPLLAANLYDFHVELFLPVEISLLFLLWLDGRYRLGLAVAGITFVTLEVAPFLVAFVAVYFFLPPLRELWRNARGAGRHADGSTGGTWGWVRPAARRWVARREVRWSLTLFALAVLAYPILRFVEWSLLAAVLPPAPNGAFGSGLISTPAPGLGLALSGAFLGSLRHKLLYWVLLVGLLGFLPLFAPRLLILELPWFVFSLQSPQIVWTTLGFQYSAVALTPLVIAAIFGFSEFERKVLPRVIALGRSWGTRHPGSTRWLPRRLAWGIREHPVRARRTAAGAVLLLLVITNFAVGPANPALQRTEGPLPAYALSYHSPSGFAAVQRLAELIPPQARILASSDLFPLVANDVNAYALLWTPNVPSQLPFGPGRLPSYALFAEDQSFAVPAWMDTAIQHHAMGLRGIVPSSAAGQVELWELGYAGTTQTFLSS